ncbi:MAG TPA: hypothetical protein VFQ42_21860 [Mycobacterium sp.]|nr:hypothetical protein [Mycobacterium sp.]
MTSADLRALIGPAAGVDDWVDALLAHGEPLVELLAAVERFCTARKRAETGELGLHAGAVAVSQAEASLIHALADVHAVRGGE